MFCMLLRKYLTGGKILALRQPPMERLAELVIEGTNEMGDKVPRRLILEAMGRRTNLILLDGEDRIVDCLRRTGGACTQARPLLPGMFYQYPEAQAGKLDPRTLTQEAFQALADSAGDAPADRFLLDHFLGLSPLLARELAFEAFGETDAPVGRDPAGLYARLARLLTQVEEGKTTPTLLMREGESGGRSPFRPILQYGPGPRRAGSCQTFGAHAGPVLPGEGDRRAGAPEGPGLPENPEPAPGNGMAPEAGSTRRQELADTSSPGAPDRMLRRPHYRQPLPAWTKGESVLRAVNYYDPEGRDHRHPPGPPQVAPAERRPVL